MVVSDSPNDDGAAMLPSLTPEMLPLATQARADMKDAVSVGGLSPSPQDCSGNPGGDS